jgi:hypothetical protein
LIFIASSASISRDGRKGDAKVATQSARDRHPRWAGFDYWVPDQREVSIPSEASLYRAETGKTFAPE